MSLEHLKINKQLVTAMHEAGILATKPIQDACVSRFAGGQDWVVIAPNKSGKTTTYAISTIAKLKYAVDVAPRALILVASRTKVEETVAIFEQLTKHTDLRVLGVYAGGGMQEQRDALFTGTDIVIGTPDRINTIYINSGLNINKLQVFVIDDAEELIKQGFQNPILRLSECMPKGQKLCFSTIYHDKLDKLVSEAMKSQGVIEIEQDDNENEWARKASYYSVLNYKTKLNLLNLLIEREDYDKILVLCNTRLTSGQLYNTIQRRFPKQVGMFNPLYYNHKKLNSISEFLEDESTKVLVLSNEDEIKELIYQVPNVLFFDIPSNEEYVVQRLQKTHEETLESNIFFFATDVELVALVAAENLLKTTIEKLDSPWGLVIDNNRKRKDEGEEAPKKGAAFHQKKASNAKTTNLGIKDKIKLYGKARKKGRT